MRTLRSMPLPLALLISGSAVAQAPSPAAQAPTAPTPANPSPAAQAPATPTGPSPAAPAPTAPAAGADGAPLASAGAELDPGVADASGETALDRTAPERRTGFTSGVRLGVGVPLGKAGRGALDGRQRSLNDLTSWRAPIWLDVAYSPTGATTLGAYGQVGSGGTGDLCTADCDWSDIRVGASAEWRFAPGAAVDPWLGLGLGYEWLSYRVLITVELPDDTGGTLPVRARATERFGGPELMLHGGIDFQVDDALRIGPYASATLSQYLTDSFRCEPASDLCPADGSIDGAAFHSWIGVGLRGAYTP